MIRARRVQYERYEKCIKTRGVRDNLRDIFPFIILGRTKRPTVYTVARSRDEGGLAELSAGLQNLLGVANHDRHQPGAPGDFARDVDRVLDLLSKGEAGSFESWPVWAGLAAKNVSQLLREGGGYLRRCRFCGCWMLIYDKRRWKCNRSDCDRVENSKYQEAWRGRTF